MVIRIKVCVYQLIATFGPIQDVPNASKGIILIMEFVFQNVQWEHSLIMKIVKVVWLIAHNALYRQIANNVFQE